MAETSAIEWTDATWNPVRGCTKISPGCVNCYAETFAERFRGVPGHPYEQGFDLRLVPEKLEEPLKWKTPKKIFVNSMSDLFHKDVPDEFVDKVFGVMGACEDAGRGHVFQVLTKRSGRMLGYMSKRCHRAWNARRLGTEAFPPRNVWLGVSVENRRHGLPRIEDLRQTPAAVRFLSVEPLLEDLGALDLTGIHWVIVGGESGRKARPMHPDWARSIRDQCQAAGVAFLFKQWGEYAVVGCPTDADEVVQIGAQSDRWLNRQGGYFHTDWHTVGMERIGKKSAGRLLDGREWNEYPGAEANR